MSSERNKPATPATIGDAMDVPEMVFISIVFSGSELQTALLIGIHADVIFWPGAIILEQLPWLEKTANYLLLSDAITVYANSDEAGE